MAPSTKRSHVLGALVTASLLAACGSPPPPQAPPPGYRELIAPGTRPAASDVERAVLRQLAQLAPNAEVTIAGHVVVAGVPYDAASGRQCRSVTIRGAAKADGARAPAGLACFVNSAWSFVPTAVTDWELPEP